jgi:hypothetical protein
MTTAVAFSKWASRLDEPQRNAGSSSSSRVATRATTRRMPLAAAGSTPRRRVVGSAQSPYRREGIPTFRSLADAAVWRVSRQLAPVRSEDFGSTELWSDCRRTGKPRRRGGTYAPPRVANSTGRRCGGWSPICRMILCSQFAPTVMGTKRTARYQDPGNEPLTCLNFGGRYWV